MKLQMLMILAIAVGAVPGIAQAEPCVPSLPSVGTQLLASAYPGYRMLQLSDLNSDDQELWKNAYQNACPGIVQGAFTGRKGAYAVLLVPVKPDNAETRAVLLQPKDDGGLTQKKIFAERRAGNLPVIRRADPGIYEDVLKQTKINAPNDVILIEHLESKITAIAYIKRGDTHYDYRRVTVP
jgi:hypothetical protein